MSQCKTSNRKCNVKLSKRALSGTQFNVGYDNPGHKGVHQKVTMQRTWLKTLQELRNVADCTPYGVHLHLLEERHPTIPLVVTGINQHRETLDVFEAMARKHNANVLVACSAAVDLGTKII